ncbi:glycosyltransferase family 39 protein [Oscillospiraceae bacterium CM]|nr:glycosyltransferase family 39 protein [Oscillospiraceae bacterium CM]
MTLLSQNNSFPAFLKKNWHLLALALIALLSFGLNFYAISKVGYGNAYYAAAIKSMTENFKNFFFVSFDPAGLVSVDKPPLGLWVQAVFVLIFGYHGWAMLLPQALSATGSSLLLYALIKKYFGRVSGLIAALVFALTPAVVVAARNNTMDMQLIFVLLVAVWFLFKAIDTSKWRFLFICAVFVGLGFNIKMLQAYMILPAVVIVYLVFAKEKFLKRLAAGVISLVIMAVISFAWVLAVDLTPAGERPYVGSSTNNTVVELIIGHNGTERLFGSGGGSRPSGAFGGDDGAVQRPQGAINGPNGSPGSALNGNLPNTQSGATLRDTTAAGNAGQNANGTSVAGTSQADGNSQIPPDGFEGQLNGHNSVNGIPMGGGGNEIGTPGVLRLWSTSLYGQASWLIVLTLFCILAKLGKFNVKQLTAKQAMLVFWIIWLMTMVVFFSFAGFWHRYYLCMVAPGVAGLVGIGLPEMVRAFREKRGWKQLLLPISLLATFALEIIFVWRYEAVRTWLVPMMLVPAAGAAIVMAAHAIRPQKLLAVISGGLTLLSLLVAPFYWSLTVVLYVEQNSTLPYAGPELASTAEIRGMTPNQEVLTTGDSGTRSLEAYLVAHYKEGTYLVVSQRANDVAQFIVDTGLPAVAYGGFLGSDNAMTLESLKALVAEGKVTYFLITGQSGGNSELTSYVKENATLIDASLYLGSTQQATDDKTSTGISGAALYLFG